MKTIFFGFFFFASSVFAQVSWVAPTNAKPGDTLTVYYNPSASGANLTNLTSLVLHWGINELPPENSGNWEEPPQSMWPTGTVAFGDGKGVESPMSENPDGTWSIRIATNDTTRSIHYVFHTGSPGTQSQAGNWTWSNNGNWNFYLVKPVNYGSKQVEFIFDPRSSGATSAGTIDTVFLAGSFNNWADNNAGVVTDTAFAMKRWNDGTYRKIVTLPIGGPVDYKFVVSGNNWYPDPDNPLVDVSNNGNSILNVDSTAPSFVEFTPASGIVFRNDTSSFAITARVLKGSSHGIKASTLKVTVDGTSVPSSIDTAGNVTATVSSPSVGRHDVVFTVSDSAGAVATSRYSFGVFPSAYGYVAVDPAGDDVGPGSYTYPSGYLNGSADIEELRIAPTPADDSLLFVLKFAHVTSNTGASIVLTSSVSSNLVQDPIVTDLQELEWQSKGIYIAIAPGQGTGKFNAVYSSRSPLTKMLNLSLNSDAMTSDSITFKLAMSDLQSILGSFTGTWYASAFSYLVDGSGNVLKIGSANGGSSSTGNPSVFDVLYLTPNQQTRLLSDYVASSSSPVFARLDNLGRGYSGITAADVGLNSTNLPVVTILTQPATTYESTWTVAGTVDKYDGSPDSAITSVTLLLNQGGARSQITGVASTNGYFSKTITLKPGDNEVQAEATNSQNQNSYSAALHIESVVDNNPTAAISFTDNGGTILVSGTSSTSKIGGPLTYDWKIDTVLSASRLTIPSSLTSSQISVPTPKVSGEYFFTLTVVDTAGDTDITRDYFTYHQDGDSISVPSMSSVPEFAKSGRIYEVFVKSFTSEGTIAAAEQKLSYIKNLGYNIIWLMPIMQNQYPIDAVGGGYGITDFYKVAPEFGTLTDFHNFIKAAHSLGLRVILDITPNHVSPAHPWVESAEKYKQYSPYWNYLQHTFANYNGAPDGLDEHYSSDSAYIHFSNWSLANLNWNNLDLRLAMLKVMKYWLDQGADGFRLDVYWGPHIRSGDANFDQPLRRAIKHRKMDAFILAEATGTGINTQQYYADDGGGADAAYDRNLWGVMANGGNPNAPAFTSSFVNTLDATIQNGGYYPGPHSYFLRYLENHDESRIAYDYSNIQQTMPLAAVLMTIPGIPMIYAGQEVGFGAGLSQFNGKRGTIDFNTAYASELQPLYEKLGWIRGTFKAFDSQTDIRLTTGNGLVYGFARPYMDQNAITLANFSSSSASANITLVGNGSSPNVYLAGGSVDGKTYYMNDVYTGKSTPVTFSNGQFTFNATLPAYGTDIYILSDTVVTVAFPGLTAVKSEDSAKLPKTFSLSQNYPNPFNPTTTIRYALPSRSQVTLEVYNTLGQLVRTLVNSEQSAGEHEVVFDGDGLASGVYFYRLSAGSFVKINKMMMIK